MKDRSFCLTWNGHFSFCGFYLFFFQMEQGRPLPHQAKKSNHNRLNFSKHFFQPLIDTKNCAGYFHVYYSLNVSKMKSLPWYSNSASQMNHYVCSFVHSFIDYLLCQALLSTTASTKINKNLCSSGTQSRGGNIGTNRCDTRWQLCLRRQSGKVLQESRGYPLALPGRVG